MSLLGLFPGEDDNRLDELSRGQGADPAGAGFFEGSLGAIPGGVEHGAASLGQAAGDATSKFLTGITQPLYESQFQYGGGMSGGVVPPIQRNPQDIERDNEQSTARFVKQYEQDPRTNGFVSQNLFGLADVATRMAPAALTGPAAPYVAPALVGATTGYDVKKQLQSQGVDEATAEKMALTQGAFAAAGVSVPFGVGGKLLTKLITGASTNVSFGMVERGGSAAILRDAGYDKMAEQYQPLDHQAMVTDAIMGTFFGGMAHLHSLPPSVADLALKSSEALHVEHATDGIPATPDARADHLYNFGETMRAALNGEEPVGLRDVQTVPDPAQEAARATNAQVLGDVVAETTGEPAAAPIKQAGQAAYPFYDMTAEELQAHEDASSALVAAEEGRILGDKADDWRKAVRQSQSSNDAVSDKGSARLAEIERGLSSEDMDTLYGGPKSRLHNDAYEDLSDFRSGLSFGSVHTPQEAIQTLKYQLGKLGNTKGSDPSGWTREQQVAWATMRQVREQAVSHGWDTNEITQKSIAAAASRFNDPRDAEAMLERFLKPRESVTERKKLPSPAEPAPITNERRASVIDDSRLSELSAKYDSDTPLNAAEMSEMIKLQRDRAMNARVGNLPIRGVLSREGANNAIQDQSFSHMTIVDASDFKPINDRFGHPVGDQVIQHIGQTLRRFAPPDSVVEHRGGDEFIIHHNDEAAGHETVAKANEVLAGQKIHAVDEAGNILDTKEGVLLAHGTGTNENDIETKLQLDKAAQKSGGQRVGERDQPATQPNAGGVDQRFAKGSGGDGDGGTGRDTAVSEPAVPSLDPETAEAVEAAQRALADNPRLNIPADETTGAEPRAAADALKAALDDITNGQTDADITQVAAACFARTL